MKILSVIKNEGSPDDLVWKCPEEDFNTSSTLIVNESEEALFIKNGVVVQQFDGGRYKLSTSNYPWITKLRNKTFFGGDSPFNCKVYFVNKTHKLELYWGTDTPMQVRDAEFGFMVSVRARGSYSIQIADAKKFLVKLLGMNFISFTQDNIEESFRSAFVMSVKANLATMMKNLKMTILDVASEYYNIANAIIPDLQKVLDEYGIKLVNFYIVDISIPENDPNYTKINNAYAEKGTVKIQGEDWDRITAKEILKDTANNGSAGGLGAGIGLGLGALGALAGMSQNSFGGGFNTQAQQKPQEVKQPSAQGGFVFCSECGTKNPSNAKFCSNCGSKLAISNHCPECGAELKPGAKFCSECGAKL